ncbi:hypothetical protein FA15DRAFT_684096 [Coprinopsis marcescibilis]|uniref:Uncharacterized protein n=1 Tax=Coprinopsis marcescibilis TaxID=230819 RepID=A0A5C3LFI8_COPMA|nr:hypothetical protein FA15DRAFT_684096 [Coprinopsis marcescibilis]
MNPQYDCEYFRIPTSSSSFYALATLNPPSPTPPLVSSISSIALEDLPIFLVDSVRPDSYQFPEYPTSLSEDNAACDEPASANSLTSFVSVGSFGTFGPKVSPLPVGNFEDDLEVYSRLTHKYSLSSLLEAIPEDSAFPESPLIIQDNIAFKDFAHSKHIRAVKEFNTKACSDLAVELSVPTRDHLGNPTKRETSKYRGDQTQDSHLSGFGNRGPNRKDVAKANKDSARHDQTQTVDFVWLHGVSIDLLIDQEGFRSVVPSFRYSGANQYGPGDGSGCTVTFRPVAKHAFYFHYNPFDASPILRRLTIHGEETRDYISKQAHLSLKSNGIYSVHGAEVSSLSMHPFQLLGQAGDSKLEWEFQYLVGDRMDAHGNLVDGEKKFVPLTFTCSPWLLHPSQGKRINLVHIFKKGVSTKLVAEKSVRPARVGEMVDSEMLKSPLGRNHRRVQSHEVGDPNTFERSNRPQVMSPTDPAHRSRPNHNVSGSLRRRASSAGMAR